MDVMTQANFIAYDIVMPSVIVENSLNAYLLTWTFATQYFFFWWLSFQISHQWVDIEPSDYLYILFMGVDLINTFLMF